MDWRTWKKSAPLSDLNFCDDPCSDRSRSQRVRGHGSDWKECRPDRLGAARRNSIPSDLAVQLPKTFDGWPPRGFTPEGRRAGCGLTAAVGTGSWCSGPGPCQMGYVHP